MIARISTHLDASGACAWAAVKRPATLVHVARGMLGFTGSERFPDVWHEGEAVTTRLLFFHILPSWRHELRIMRVDEKNHEILSHEQGGPVRKWNHLIRIVDEASNGCRYTDEIAIDAGIITIVVWAFANVFYRYRQMRWRGLTRALFR
jgi:hypothetical protein